jgi:hypothetical protein
MKTTLLPAVLRLRLAAALDRFEALAQKTALDTPYAPLENCRGGARIRRGKL